MDNNKHKTADPALDLKTDEKPKEEWLQANSTKGSEPGMKPSSGERPREVWKDEKGKKKE